MLITRGIPTLTNPSPPSHQWGFQSPLSATAQIANKNAAICVVLLLFQNYHLFKPNSSVSFGGDTQIPMIGHLLDIIAS
jgi:hypothetical protein